MSNGAVYRLEDRLRASLQNREVLVLLRYQKALVYFTVALRSLEHLLVRYQMSSALGPSARPLLDA